MKHKIETTIGILVTSCILALFIVSSLFTPSQVEAQQTGSGWHIFHAPAANTQATITRAAQAGAVHVAECVVVRLVAGATAPTAATATINLRDGVSGMGTILAAWPISITAVAGATAEPVQICGLDVRGSLNTAMTLEYTAASGANTIQSVELVGHDRR